MAKVFNASAIMDMSDDELDSMIDESTLIITVHGRIGNVRWLEQEGAAKRPSGKYYEYHLELPADAQKTTDLLRRLSEEEESGAGIWTTTGPKFHY